MESVDIVLGKDWLDVAAPLIDWCSYGLYIRQRDQLHIVPSGPKAQPCGTRDRGPNGLKDSFSLLYDQAATDLQFRGWGDLFAQLAPP